MKLSNVLYFAVGAAIGSSVTWKLVKTKYERIANEEIESVKEVFAKKLKSDDADEEDTEEDHYVPTEEDRNVMVKIMKDNNYIREGEDGIMSNNVPYLISPDEFGELDEHDTTTLYFYADEVLAYENGDVVDDVDYLIGDDALNHFGEYEEDSVFVRNDALKTDYEVLRSEETYEEAYVN